MNYRAVNIASIIIKVIVTDNNSSVDSCLHIEINDSFSASVMPESILLYIEVEFMIYN
jgi:hypothetical protein